MDEKYGVKFKCTNCEHIFGKQFKKGMAAPGRAGDCPNCGCNQDTVGANNQKIGVFPIIPLGENEPKKKTEILLEGENLVIKRERRE